MKVTSQGLSGTKRTPQIPFQTKPNSTTLEIERRFLIKKIPENCSDFTGEYIEQGYIETKEGTSIRIRQREGVCYLTIKKGSGKIREEAEIIITQEQYNMLWPITKNRRIKKTRYEISYNGHIIELDIYNGKLKGLITAEVEFPSEKDCDHFSPPQWFGKEVTDIKEYSNRSLAKFGLPLKQKLSL